MVEGGGVRADKTQFTECFKTVWKTPYTRQYGIVYNLLRTRNGDGSMDCELRKIPIEIQSYRGICGGIAAISNWTSNLIVSMSFLSIRKLLEPFIIFAGISFVGLIFIFFVVPETKGMRFEEIEKVLQKGYRPKLFKGCF